ncbi:hypothetical protein LQ564_03300 [Massilia sp. G4R7]|uniref:Uncharacterized protein n=1 Tax=Massilia phyllostachyos TaxID=2898585 RepID=A0ABS8Q0Q6_9BURK|nr:hypothetical protein [Massilia phyllostachyos]MCD2515335.1 hypothetical protein [Massilia phyllostachyos]
MKMPNSGYNTGTQAQIVVRMGLIPSGIVRVRGLKKTTGVLVLFVLAYNCMSYMALERMMINGSNFCGLNCLIGHDVKWNINLWHANQDN